jgi:serine/threonine protein phosphatase PrpC
MRGLIDDRISYAGREISIPAYVELSEDGKGLPLSGYFNVCARILKDLDCTTGGTATPGYEFYGHTTLAGLLEFMQSGLEKSIGYYKGKLEKCETKLDELDKSIKEHEELSALMGGVPYVTVRGSRRDSVKYATEKIHLDKILTGLEQLKADNIKEAISGIDLNSTLVLEEFLKVYALVAAYVEQRTIKKLPPLLMYNFDRFNSTELYNKESVGRYVTKFLEAQAASAPVPNNFRVEDFVYTESIMPGIFEQRVALLYKVIEMCVNDTQRHNLFSKINKLLGTNFSDKSYKETQPSLLYEPIRAKYGDSIEDDSVLRLLSDACKVEGGYINWPINFYPKLYLGLQAHIKTPDILPMVNDYIAVAETMGNYRPSQEDAFEVAVDVSIANPRKFLRTFLKQQAAALKKEESGSCAIMVHCDENNQLTTANVGDSIAFVLYKSKTAVGFTAKRLTKLHTLQEPLEERLYIGGGGRIVKSDILRTEGNCSVPRAFGDYIYIEDEDRTFFVGDDYDEAQYDLSKFLDANKYTDAFVVIACDGLFEKATEQFYVDLINELYEQNPSAVTAYNLSKLFKDAAVKSRSLDNITVAVAPLTSQRNWLYGVFDGHKDAYVAKSLKAAFAEAIQLAKTRADVVETSNPTSVPEPPSPNFMLDAGGLLGSQSSEQLSSTALASGAVEPRSVRQAMVSGLTGLVNLLFVRPYQGVARLCGCYSSDSVQTR